MHALLTAGKNYIAENVTKLTDGGMPAGFEAGYDAARNDFEILYRAFMDGQQDERELRDAKIVANNALNKKLMAMFLDGQLIYKYNAANRKRFIFLKVRALVLEG